MPTITDTSLFTPWQDPATGITSYILTQRVAPLQQSFYFVNDPSTADGRYLWFYCAYPPSGHSAFRGRFLGVIDFEQGTVQRFLDTQFTHASPYIDTDTGEAFWCTGPAIYKRTPDPGDRATLVNALPDEFIGWRDVSRLATHLTRSADGKAFFVDSAVGLHHLFGSLPIDGGDYELWHKFDRHHNHAQFSPTDPGLVLFAQEFHVDLLTGHRLPITDRLWLMRRGESPRPVFAQPTIATHEWWDADGKHAWCIDPDRTTWRVNIETAKINVDWPGATWHAHNHPTEPYLVGDNRHNGQRTTFRGSPSTVCFGNYETGQHVEVTHNPEFPGPVGEHFHIDPHPRFIFGGGYVAYTTTVLGQIDLALVPTDSLVDRLS